jgi:hypothetical protein
MIDEKEIKKNPMFLHLAVLTISSTIGLQAMALISLTAVQKIRASKPIIAA